MCVLHFTLLSCRDSVSPTKAKMWRFLLPTVLVLHLGRKGCWGARGARVEFVLGRPQVDPGEGRAGNSSAFALYLLGG